MNRVATLLRSTSYKRRWKTTKDTAIATICKELQNRCRLCWSSSESYHNTPKNKETAGSIHLHSLLSGDVQFLLVFAFTLWRCLTVPNDQVFFGKNFADRLQGRFFFTTFPWTNIEEQPTFKAWVSLLCRKGTWALFFSARAMTVCSRKLRDLLMYMASRWSWPSDYNTSSKHSIEAVSSNINAAKFRSAFFAQRR